MKEHKRWNKLNTLNLNATGLTDEGLKYLGEANMPKLKKLNIVGKPSINGLRMNHIHVTYCTQAERDKEKKEREKEMKKRKRKRKGKKRRKKKK